MEIPPEKLLYVQDRDGWRAWLQAHHATEREVWLVAYKKHTGRPGVPYDEAVEEALCLGWIDSVRKTVDEDRSAQRFSPRVNRLSWTQLNLDRVQKLIQEGRMTAAGLAVLPPADAPPPPERYEVSSPLPEMFAQALEANPTAAAHFHQMAPSYRRDFVRWVIEAKKEETRQRRLTEALRLLEENRKLGMK